MRALLASSFRKAGLALRHEHATWSASSWPARRRTPPRWRPAPRSRPAPNAAGAAAGRVYEECHALADARGASAASFTGTAGAGDLVATVLAAHSRNRRAGELLAQGVDPAEIPAILGQVPESLHAVPVLARAMSEAGRARHRHGASSRRSPKAASRPSNGPSWRAGHAPARGPPERARWRLRAPGVRSREAMGHQGTRPAGGDADKAELDREFSDFYREHLRDVYNYTYYRTGNHHDAEDLTTQTFIQAYRHFERAQRESNGRPLRPWLIRIAHNLAANYYRDRKRKPTATLDGMRRSESRTTPRTSSWGGKRRLRCSRESARCPMIAGRH